MIETLEGLRGQEWRLLPAGVGAKLSRGDWESAAHLELLSQKWAETAFGVNRRRLAISTPPRHGKSEHGLHWAPTWYLDLFPNRSIAMVMFGAEVAHQWSKKLRDTIDMNPADLRVQIRKDARRMSHLQTTAGGNVYALGVGGQLTSRGVHVLDIDDPHKDWQEANSFVYRDRVWNWYLSTARTRLDPVRSGPRPAVMITATRWHEDDLIGRVIEEQGTIEDGGLWEVINLPALALSEDETGFPDPLGRAPGEPLWPEMFDREHLEEIRDEVGEYVWSAMYQGRPSPPEGAILLRRWWKFYDAIPSNMDIDYIVQSWDLSFKEKDDSDFVVGLVIGVSGNRRYILDQTRDRMSFVKTLDAIRAAKLKWPRTTGIYIEEAANGAAVVDSLHREIEGIVPVPPDGSSKEARVHAVAPFVRAGNVWLPARGARWVEDFIRECASFPKGMNDDQVDAFTQGMIETGAFAGMTLGKYTPGGGVGRR